MKKICYPTKDRWEELIKRPVQSYQEIEEKVAEVFTQVLQTGDEAVRKYTHLFDKVDIVEPVISISKRKPNISTALKKSILLAKKNIEKFHKAQKTKEVFVETTKGVYCWQKKKAIEKVGLYIPAGTAPLFSSILMLAIPAKIAGCSEIILCTPPHRNGEVDDAILYTAKICGIDKIFLIGGIQAIAAMAIGTQTVPKTYKIFGAGNQYVTVAKQFATKYGVTIDMPAGPSELLVVADQKANPVFVAADLLSQAEHGIDSQVLLVSTSKTLIEKVEKEIKKQIIHLPRKEIIEKALENSLFILMEKNQKCIDFINHYAPEHLIINVKAEKMYLNKIINAGSVFIGNFTPESAGDYASGTNHVLPTNGYAKMQGGVCLDSFLKTISYQKMRKKGLKNIYQAIETLAEAENLQAHKNAITLRMKK